VAATFAFAEKSIDYGVDDAGHDPKKLRSGGAALQCKGQHEEAIAAFRQAIALRPDYVEAITGMGNALRAFFSLNARVGLSSDTLEFLLKGMLAWKPIPRKFVNLC
jgi:tetratricopeptide (TPR) repeat protein